MPQDPEAFTAAERQAIDEQIAYYRARASEYDQWFLRLGRYDRGEDHRRTWLGEVAAVRARIERAGLRGNCLELACGTGLWTERLAQQCDTVTAVDSSPEVLRINRERVGSPRVAYVEADLFSWAPSERYDSVFFSFWLSHVPPSRFSRFWRMVRQALRPEGVAFFIDSLADPEAPARGSTPDAASAVEERKLNDGRTFHVVKIYYEPSVLEARLRSEGWLAEVETSGRFFLVGEARP